MISLPTWAIWSIAVAAMLSPVLAFLMAIAVEIVIGALVDAGVLPVFASSPPLRSAGCRSVSCGSVSTGARQSRFEGCSARCWRARR
jgi:hypothetical protein